MLLIPATLAGLKPVAEFLPLGTGRPPYMLGVLGREPFIEGDIALEGIPEAGRGNPDLPILPVPEGVVLPPKEEGG